MSEVLPLGQVLIFYGTDVMVKETKNGISDLETVPTLVMLSISTPVCKAPSTLTESNKELRLRDKELLTYKLNITPPTTTKSVTITQDTLP